MQSWRNTLNYYRWLQAFWSCLLFSVYNARHDILRTMRKNCILWQDLCKFTLKKKEVHFNKFWKKIATLQSALKFRAQLFKGRISASPSVKFTLGFFFFVQKHFLGQFSQIFMEHRITNLLTKRIKLNLLYKVMWQSKKFIFWLKIIPLKADKRYRF